MDSAFFSSIAPTRHRVYGYNLKPFSLIHSVWLDALDSPFVTGKRFPVPSDAMQAAVICSQEWPTIDRLKVPKFRALLFSLKQAEQIDRFRAYVAAYQQFPNVWQEAEGTKFGSPWQMRIAALLISSGLSRREAWTMAIGEASWHATCLSEVNSGTARVVSDADQKAMDELKAMKSQELPPHIKAISEAIKKKYEESNARSRNQS